MEFIKDCLNVKMTLQDVATKWGITLDELVERYNQYADTEIMNQPTAYKITMLNDATHYVKDYKYIDNQTIVTYPHQYVLNRDMIKRIEVMQ